MWWSWVVLGGVCVCVVGFFFLTFFFPSLITRWLCQWCTFCPRVTVLTHCIVSIEKQKSPSPPILLHNNWEGVSVVLRSLARRLLHSKLFANEISDNFFFFVCCSQSAITKLFSNYTDQKVQINVIPLLGLTVNLYIWCATGHRLF